VVGNGTHTDPIFEKLESGMNIRDSLISCLFGMDYEHDDYSTPRIAAVASKNTKTSALGIIRADGIEVKLFKLEPGTYQYISTYERNHISPDYSGKGLDPSTVDDTSQFIIDQGEFSKFINPVSSASALETETGFEASINNLRNSSYRDRE
jgi:IMP cyclohydrolase